MPDKPYLRKLESIEDFDVWEVDGKYVRDNVDREFTNFGQHFRFPFIPLREFWIDKQFGADESRYFIDHMITEWNLMSEGKSYDYALESADKLEVKERKKSASTKKAEKVVSISPDVVPKNVYKEKLKQFEGVDVWVISGVLVRGLYFIDFTEGGHHFVYDFIPFNEVWLDDDLNPTERDFVLLHELHERYLMHTGWTYEHAHHSSSIIEYKCRRDPKQLKERMAAEIENNKKVISGVPAIVAGNPDVGKKP